MPTFIEYFLKSKKTSAGTAKSRMKQMMDSDRALRNMPEFIPGMKKELLSVVERYYPVLLDDIKMNLDFNTSGGQILQLHIPIPAQSSPRQQRH